MQRSAHKRFRRLRNIKFCFGINRVRWEDQQWQQTFMRDLLRKSDWSDIFALQTCEHVPQLRHKSHSMLRLSWKDNKNWKNFSSIIVEWSLIKNKCFSIPSKLNVFIIIEIRSWRNFCQRLSAKMLQSFQIRGRACLNSREMLLWFNKGLSFFALFDHRLEDSCCQQKCIRY